MLVGAGNLARMVKMREGDILEGIKHLKKNDCCRLSSKVVVG